MSIRIFIGSSTEGLRIAKYIQAVLNNDPLNQNASNKTFECILWNDGTVFQNNTSYLDSLLKAASMFDFGILLATKDDRSVMRQKGFKTPRDNVIFEFGLFIGRLGPNRAYVIQEKEAKLPSDMAGINVAQFTASKNLKTCTSLNHEIGRLRDNILEKINQPELGLLPSTGLAIGFYNAYIAPICDHLFDAKKVKINGTTYKKFEMQIFFPTDLKERMRMESYKYFRENGFKECTFKTSAGRPVKTEYKVDDKDPARLILLDMPTTLNALYHAIVLYLKKGTLGKSAEQNLIEARELTNFKLTIREKLKENSYYNSIVKIVDEKD